MKNDVLPLDEFTFEQLKTVDGLKRLDARFLSFLEAQHPALLSSLHAYRRGHVFAPTLESALLIDWAMMLEQFIADFFSITAELASARSDQHMLAPLFAFKTAYVKQYAKKQLKSSTSRADFATLDQWLSQEIAQHTPDSLARELRVALYAAHVDAHLPTLSNSHQKLRDWCVQALATEAGRRATAGWVCFTLPEKIDPMNPVPTLGLTDDSTAYGLPSDQLKARDGFALTDQGFSPEAVMSEIDYCVLCHKNETDFCSKGFPVKKSDPSQGYKKDVQGDPLLGCPLEEKISEMHTLKLRGHQIGALAMIMRDNPLCPATGHRVCNDCMRSCIYQKQTPVNVPAVETRVLNDVLALPWGVEIYDLLVSWNPLRPKQYLPKDFNHKRVMVVGMGPAGFSLAHHLLMEGCAVVGVDGLKIEPLLHDAMTQPVKYYQDLYASLDQRLLLGFGGVAEYGITARWDKNYLKLIYLTLMRRPYFQLYGSVRLGGTLTVEQVWSLGFDHLALAMGAGLPRALMLPNSLAPGMRQAHDFLMTLQLTGAQKQESLVNYQVQLPAVVIGGGLTAVDTATEVQAYYIVQVEKMAKRYQLLCQHYGQASIRSAYSAKALVILDTFIKHALQIAQERHTAALEQRAPNFSALIHRWGGVSIVYRGRMQQSPAARLNPHELDSALQEGVWYRECYTPKKVLLDQDGAVSGLVCLVGDVTAQQETTLAAQSIFVATGAQPNVAYEYEHRGTFVRDQAYYQAFNLDSASDLSAADAKSNQVGFFTSYDRDDKRVSFLGDMHPLFHGSVVKAIASGQRAYPSIMAALAAQAPGSYRHADFSTELAQKMQAQVHSVQRIGSAIVELVVTAPLAAMNFLPGQFYRLQNFEVFSERVRDTLLQTEAVALLATPVAGHSDRLSFWVHLAGASRRIMARFTPGMPVALMGPSGVRIRADGPKTVVMVVGDLNAFIQLRSLGPLLREQGHVVVFVGGFDPADWGLELATYDHFADHFFWLPAGFSEQYASEGAALVDALQRIHRHQWQGADGFDLAAVNRVIAIGPPTMMRALRVARSQQLSDCFRHNTQFYSSVYSAMQCMLKGVCAQCLQWQIDPVTGERTKAVYACSWQQQPMDMVDFDHLEQRLGQNAVQERLTEQWLEFLLSGH